MILVLLLVLLALGVGFALGAAWGVARARAHSLAAQQVAQYEAALAAKDELILKLRDGSDWERRFRREWLETPDKEAE